MSSAPCVQGGLARPDSTQVEERIVEDDCNKWDLKAGAHELRVAPDGLLDVGVARFAQSELATSQMCQRLGIPVPYYRRLPHELQAAVPNHDFGRLHENEYLLRGKDEWVRAFLSTDYVAYNIAQIAETVKELLQQAPVAVKCSCSKKPTSISRSSRKRSSTAAQGSRREELVRDPGPQVQRIRSRRPQGPEESLVKLEATDVGKRALHALSTGTEAIPVGAKVQGTESSPKF
jgi:hypothetical protein